MCTVTPYNGRTSLTGSTDFSTMLTFIQCHLWLYFTTFGVKVWKENNMERAELPDSKMNKRWVCNIIGFGFLVNPVEKMQQLASMKWGKCWISNKQFYLILNWHSFFLIRFIFAFERSMTCVSFLESWSDDFDPIYFLEISRLLSRSSTLNKKNL